MRRCFPERVRDQRARWSPVGEKRHENPRVECSYRAEDVDDCRVEEIRWRLQREKLEERKAREDVFKTRIEHQEIRCAKEPATHQKHDCSRRRVGTRLRASLRLVSKQDLLLGSLAPAFTGLF